MTATTNALFPIKEFTNCKQSIALAERFGDRDLAKMQQTDEVALLAILAVFVQRRLADIDCTIEQAAEQTITEEADNTSEEMPEILEIVEGIGAGDAIALIQFLLQED